MIDQIKAKEAFDFFYKKASADERIIGIIMAGGRGKGVATDNSDYDVILITNDPDLEAVKTDYPKTEYIDSLPHSLSDFRERAKTGTRTQYDKYTFTHVTALVDRTGEIQKLIEEKGNLNESDAHTIGHDAAGGYFNMLHRSIKNFRDGNTLAGHLDALETIPRLIKFVFAIERRVAPFNKFLAWELENYPLSKLPLSADDFLNKIKKIATTGDLETQKDILLIIRHLASTNGHQDQVLDWDGYYFG